LKLFETTNSFSFEIESEIIQEPISNNNNNNINNETCFDDDIWTEQYQEEESSSDVEVVNFLIFICYVSR